jgi:hypothetical protein
MKKIVRERLEEEKYVVVEELLFPPSGRLFWSAYRPDLLGYRRGQGSEEVVLVECETNPNMRRFGSKNYSSVWFQPLLFRSGSVRRILAVPRGRLRQVDMRLRSGWEIWVVGANGMTEKAGLISKR